jgi:predicted RNA binding protein YcfA (HicA-like mRNA interferase family)
MPPYIPGVNRRELIRILRRLNFRESEGGDHTVFHHHRLGLRTSVPRHSGVVSPRTVGSILEQIGLTRTEFDEARRRRGRIPERFQE